MEKTRVLVADPPWPSPRKSLFNKPDGTALNYPTYPLMTARQIKDFDLPPLADQCTLFLWRLTNMQEMAIDVMHEWGFKLYGEIVWVKLRKDGQPRTGMGMMIRGAHETCLIGTRGGLVKPLATRHGVIQAPWRGHSRKPEELFELIEAVWAGPYTELFARRKREGWRCLGNEVLSE